MNIILNPNFPSKTITMKIFDIWIFVGRRAFLYIKLVNQMRKEEVNYFELAHVKGLSHHHLCFVRESKAGRGVGQPAVETREGFRCALIGGCWHIEAEGRWPTSRSSNLID